MRYIPLSFIFLLLLAFPTISQAASLDDITISVSSSSWVDGTGWVTNTPQPEFSATVTGLASNTPYSFELFIDGSFQTSVNKSTPSGPLKASLLPPALLSEGSHVYRVIMKNQSGTILRDKTANVTVSSAAPSLFVYEGGFPINSVRNIPDTTFQIDINDHYLLSLTSVSFSLDGLPRSLSSVTSTISNNKVIYKGAYEAKGLSEGAHVWTLNATNSRGKTNTISGTFQVSILPSEIVGLTTPSSTQTLSAFRNLNFKFVRSILNMTDGVFIQKTELIINGKVVNTISYPGHMPNYSISGMKGLKNGTNTWALKITNNYGKTSLREGNVKATTNAVISPEQVIFLVRNLRKPISIPVQVRINNRIAKNRPVVCKISGKVVARAKTNNLGRAACKFIWHPRKGFLNAKLVISAPGALASNTELRKRFR